MKLGDQRLLEKTFPFVIYDENGKEKERKEIVMRELTSAEADAIRARCTTHTRTGDVIDQTRVGRLMFVKMLLVAPFESEDGTPWASMKDEDKLRFINGLSINYEMQLAGMVREMEVKIPADIENLS